MRSVGLLPFVVKERTRHGKVVYYYRKNGGARIRLPIPSDPQFMAHYLSATQGEALEPLYVQPKIQEPQTLKWLIEQYRNSSHWASLALNTRRNHDTSLEHSLQLSKDIGYKQITSKHIRMGIERRKANPSTAVRFLVSMRCLFNWAINNGYIKKNPCDGIERPKYKTDGFKPWTKEDMRLFRSYWQEGTMPRLAFEFLLYTGLRCSDACRAGHQHLKGNVFTIKTQKTGTIITKILPDHIMKSIQQLAKERDNFFVNRYNTIRIAHQFSVWFVSISKKAGVNKSAHGVRKLSATLLAEDGATAHELLASHGWKSLSQAEVYTKGADRIQLGKKSSTRMASIDTNSEPD